MGISTEARKLLHAELDSAIDFINSSISPTGFGSCGFDVRYEKGKATLRVRERELGRDIEKENLMVQK